MASPWKLHSAGAAAGHKRLHDWHRVRPPQRVAWSAYRVASCLQNSMSDDRKQCTISDLVPCRCIILSTQWPTLLGHAPASSTLVRQRCIFACASTISRKQSCIKFDLSLSHLQAAMQHGAHWIANTNTQALLVGGVSLLCSVFTPTAVSRFVPGSLLGLVGGTLTATYTKSSARTNPDSSAACTNAALKSCVVKLLCQ